MTSFLLTALATLQPLLAAPVGTAACLFRERPILLGAHRGGCGLWPENTIEAYRNTAKRWPNTLMEGDVQLSKDGHVVVFHDSAVDRTTNGTGLVSEKTLAELKALDAGYHFTLDSGKTFPCRGKGITIPTLAEVIEALPNNLFLVEIKTSGPSVDAVIKVLRETKATQRFLLASFDPATIAHLHKHAPEIGTCYDVLDAVEMLTALRQGKWEHYTPVHAMLTLSPELEKQFNVTPAEFAAIREKGILVQFFTLNTEEEIKHYLQLPVDSILSDNPEILDRVLQAEQRK
ncbi:MAG TPA: glycerophosphodiester phosphodiesterase family protein [Candidatus Hydrogenedentes bacterium]|nr:glycerophosphodiester phosphodiesterase family protein [Candidatus Hydrogenedentota bacterium]